ncbi:MAG TPA: hypothetical protein VMM80_08565 [Bacteroidota bacterium]|nr:hypothetical protein [Bacteroidota bacterium]
MTLLDAFIRYDLPLFARKSMMNRLVRMTAEAFGTAPPDLGGLKPESALQRYALFTREEVARIAGDPARRAAVQERLYRASSTTAASARRLLGVTHWEAAAAVARRFYGYIGIDMNATPRGNITISSCVFSRYYSPDTCDVVSALDSGMIAGLAGDGDLTFSSRITEGAPCCRACFRYRRPQR